MTDETDRGTLVLPQTRVENFVADADIRPGLSCVYLDMSEEGKPMLVGGKTGSGDNRFETVSASGQRTSSRTVDRTATFVFFIENRFFGVVTAYVPGQNAEDYQFTSSLPVALLKLMAPDIQACWSQPPQAAPRELALASTAR